MVAFAPYNSHIFDDNKIFWTVSTNKSAETRLYLWQAFDGIAAPKTAHLAPVTAGSHPMHSHDQLTGYGFANTLGQCPLIAL